MVVISSPGGTATVNTAATVLPSALYTQKRLLVLSCPEKGSHNPNDTMGPYTADVMDKIQELHKRSIDGSLKLAFERKGRTMNPSDEGKLTPELVRSTGWYYGYQTRVQSTVLTELHGFNGILQVACINGGPVSQVEQQDVPAIVRDATLEAYRSDRGVCCAIEPLRNVSFARFCEEFANGETTTETDQHEADKQKLRAETARVAKEYDDELRDVMKEKEVVVAESKKVMAECATLKAQLSERDRELAAAKAGTIGTVVSGRSEPVVGAAAVCQASTGGEPGYMELLGWTVVPKAIDLPSRSNDTWDRIHNHHAGVTNRRLLGEGLIHDTDLLVDYVESGGPSDRRDWHNVSHEENMVRQVRELSEEARSVVIENRDMSV